MGGEEDVGVVGGPFSWRENIHFLNFSLFNDFGESISLQVLVWLTTLWYVWSELAYYCVIHAKVLM